MGAWVIYVELQVILVQSPMNYFNITVNNDQF